MLKVTGSAMPGPMSLLFPTPVFAASRDGDPQPSASSLLRDELSLYTAPPPLQKLLNVQPEAGQLEQSVATLREFTEPYTGWCKDTYSTIQPKVQSVVQCGSDTYAYLKDPPKDFYPRAGVVGFTGVLGLFLARGSRIKRFMLPAGLMTVSASMYYPEKAATIVKSAGDSVYDRAVQSYAALEKKVNPQSQSGKDSETKP
ncbi:hypothetical protein CesoFtcFv8_015461 [Champsocephalus esox]|uniref:MICOS complex subunit n=1 Tax=Champsocephalus esox TaxID=159716 RepID=A0AAN8GRP0_9TELE|nr:hypothetical protein CesoFtcFv8_015461 [Champsocephalus esox]